MKKYILGGIGCLFVTGILLQQQLFVEAEDNVLLHPNGNKAAVVLEAGELKDEVVSLQISFQVETKEGDSQKNQVAFEFDKSITSAVRQYRYHKDTGTLNVYVAGKEDLGKDGELSLGNVVLSSDYEHGALASVKVVDQSLVTVNKAFDKQTPLIGSGSLEGSVELTVGNGGKAPEQPPADDKEPDDPENPDNPKEPMPDDKEDTNPPSLDEGGQNPPSEGGDSEGPVKEDRPVKKKGGGSHSSGSSQPAAGGTDASLTNLLQGALDRRPKTVQGTLQVATVDETDEEETTDVKETDLTEPIQKEEEPKEEADTSKEDEGFLAENEEVVEKAVDVGLVAGIASAIVVLILIAMEYRRRLIRRRRSKMLSKFKKK